VHLIEREKKTERERQRERDRDREVSAEEETRVKEGRPGLGFGRSCSSFVLQDGELTEV
jgi:hypothetical protein